ncbi:MMPL family protein [Mycobacterium xenopi 4042]|uniref:MMPL family protein n=1 Tax=Mycobacterium xenopi 4042 TaxID=1299334 RepID=X7ZMY0_MYCXE|nr:MMPL family protein [Mycobacterium xenopi 4042]
MIEMLVAKGVIATLGHFGYIELSSFAVNIVVALTLGAGPITASSYWAAITRRDRRRKPGGRLLHRIQGCHAHHRRLGADHRRACYCLTFARLNYFHTMDRPLASPCCSPSRQRSR